MKPIALAAAVALVLLGGVACSGPAPKSRQVSPGVIRDVPPVLRGTIGSTATLRKADPILVSGYGLVVGLAGTGGGDLDPRTAATMERQLGLKGIARSATGLEGTPLEGMTPQQVLQSKDVAVVVVYAAVSPGSPLGSTFDVYVRAVNKGPDISLEGGLLWTTDLQVGPPAPMDGYQTRKLATARGPVFVNPFAEPGTRGRMSRHDGRILSGGVVTNPMDLELILNSDSHSLATAVTRAVNNRFPAGPGEDVTARGRSPRVINVTIPTAYRHRAQDFINLLMHTRVDQTAAPEFAKQYVETLRSQPYLSEDLRWALEALPQKTALPFLRDLYDSPQERERWAALRAGAGLGDPLSAPRLKQLAKEGASLMRTGAISLLGRLSAGPTIDLALQEQLGSDLLRVRVAAYEALVGRAEREQLRRWQAQQRYRHSPTQVQISERAFDEARAQLELSANSPQGIERRLVEGKFLLDLVPQGEPLIYIAQQGRPRITVFGRGVELRRPLLISAWGGEDAPSGSPDLGGIPKLPRLMLVADSATDDIRILYRFPDRYSEGGDPIPGRTMTSTTKPDLASLVELLARQPSPQDPRPGFGMSYSEVVGSIYAIHRQGGLNASLAIEEDRFRASLLAAANSSTVPERPETGSEESSLTVFEPVDKPETPAAAQPGEPGEKPSLVVPLPPVDPEKKD